MKSCFIIVGALALFIVATPVMANVTEVFLIFNMGCNADFTASVNPQPDEGTLSWSEGAQAQVYMDNDPHYVVFTGVDIAATWSQCTDTSDDLGNASATFGEGSFTINLYNGASSEGLITGSLWTDRLYNEGETGDDFLYGAALVRIDSFYLIVDNVEYGWQGGEGDIAGITATTQLAQGTDLTDYQSDWSSDNCIVTLVANESGIPEPATICLLGLGAMVLIRKRRA